jgi:hypothetical protein
MDDATAADGRRCPRCSRTTTPRGGEPPRFCAVCGCPLPAGPISAVPDLAGLARFPLLPAAAVLIGLLALLPFCGFPLGVLAIGLGAAGRRHRRLRGQPSRLAEVLARIAIVFGLVGVARTVLMIL